MLCNEGYWPGVAKRRNLKTQKPKDAKVKLFREDEDAKVT